MKPKKFVKKLELNKHTIANLTDNGMEKILGGQDGQCETGVPLISAVYTVISNVLKETCEGLTCGMTCTVISCVKACPAE